MADARFARLQRAVTLVPLALLSAAWSVSIAGSGSVGTAASATADGTTSPTDPNSTPGSATQRAPSGEPAQPAERR